MMIKVVKSLFAFSIVICLAFFFPVTTVASANNYELNSPPIIFKSTSENARDAINISVENLTPQERQKVQAIRQRRNKEIIAVLDNSQLQKFSHYLHTGQDFNQAIVALELSSEQRNLINAIIDFTNLKMKEIVADHELIFVHK